MKSLKKSSKAARKSNKVETINKRKFPCNQCEKKLTSAAHLKRHLKSTHTLKDFICDFDGKHFNTKDKLRLHIYLHRKYYRVECNVCQKEYKTNQSMRKHLRTHFEKHQCESCGQTFLHKRLLNNHIAAIHKEEQNFQCNYCTRLFSSTTTRDSHQKIIHQDQQVNTGYFKCLDCPLGFEMKEELRIHSFIHWEGEIHTCLDCNQIFKKRKLLNNHMMKHELASFKCEVCNHHFKYRSNLGKHKKDGRCKGPAVVVQVELENSPEKEAEVARNQLVQMTVDPRRVVISNIKDYKLQKSVKVEVKKEKIDESSLTFESYADDVSANSDVFEESEFEPPEPRSKRSTLKRKTGSTYECDLCDFTADKKCEILSHIRFHRASIRHRCKQCEETFTTKVSLHNHSMKIHGRGVMGSIEYSSGAAICTLCHRIFSQERLKYHMKLHETPTFSCDRCGKKFRQEATLAKHIASNHVSEKQFTCSTCGKSFKKMTVLKQHEETHNPYKIYVQCEICQTVMQMKSLKLHMEVKHGDRYKDKNFICQCGKAFRYEKQLEKHVEAVHDKANRGKIYPCPDCDKTFTRRLELREHSFDHFDGKVLVCECGMKFKKQKLLTLHSAVHKASQWPCRLCSMTFQSRGGRRKHTVKVHGHPAEEFVEIPSFDAMPQIN